MTDDWPFNPEIMGFKPGWDRPEPTPEPACDVCGGTGWALIPDPFLGGATTDQRCPACQDTTVRATRNCYELDNGQRLGPTGGLCQ